MEKIILNGKTYVEETTAKLSDMKIVRSYAAGVFYGEIVSEQHEVSGLVVTMKNARRLWKWVGAASLSQVALEGVKNKEDSMFPAKVPAVKLMNVVEILDMTEEAVKNLDAVKIWKM